MNKAILLICEYNDCVDLNRKFDCDAFEEKILNLGGVNEFGLKILSLKEIKKCLVRYGWLETWWFGRPDVLVSQIHHIFIE